MHKYCYLKIYTNKSQDSLLNISVVSFYDNFGLFFKGSEDTATDGIENRPLPTTAQSINASPENPSEYPHKSYTNLESLTKIAVADSIGVSSFVFT